MNQSNILIAQQFTPIYDEREDRIRLIFNINFPTRYDMWITRNFLIKLIYSLNEKLMQTLEKKSISNKTSSDKTNAQIYPPTNKEINLLVKLQITPLNNDNYLITFSDNNITIESQLTQEELSQLLKTLINITKNNWGITY